MGEAPSSFGPASTQMVLGTLYERFHQCKWRSTSKSGRRTSGSQEESWGGITLCLFTTTIPSIPATSPRTGFRPIVFRYRTGQPWILTSIWLRIFGESWRFMSQPGSLAISNIWRHTVSRNGPRFLLRSATTPSRIKMFVASHWTKRLHNERLTACCQYFWPCDF